MSKKENKKTEEMEEAQFELVLKLKKPHPHNRYNVQGVYVNGYGFKKYSFPSDKKEVVEKELKSKGCQAWISIGSEENLPQPKKKPVEKPAE